MNDEKMCKCGHFRFEHSLPPDSDLPSFSEYHKRPPGHLPFAMDKMVNHNESKKRVCTKCECKNFKVIKNKWRFWE